MLESGDGLSFTASAGSNNRSYRSRQSVQLVLVSLLPAGLVGDVEDGLGPAPDALELALEGQQRLPRRTSRALLDLRPLAAPRCATQLRRDVA